MTVATEILDRDDKLRIEMSALFKRYGYDRYRTAKFDSYEVYRRNKDYIGDESIVTLTGADGRLMALRPDVTLGIVSNHDGVSSKKYFYDENVFRRDKRGEYREIRQVGVELIGGKGAYPEYETVALAIRAMELIGEQYILSVGNIDVVERAMSELELSGEKREKVRACIRAKAIHELKRLLGEDGRTLIELVSTEGEWRSALKRVRAIMPGAESELCALETLMTALEESSLAGSVRLDFSLVNDFRYYNGVVFTGFVRGVPSAVLTGGRYDNMMKRLCRGEAAIGFALDFDLISSLPKREGGCDTLIVYADAPVEAVAAAVEKCVAAGERVLAVAEDDGSVRAKRRIYLTEEKNA